MILRACSALLAQCTFRAARFEQLAKLFEVRIEMIDRLKLGARREIPRTLPVLKPQLPLVAHDLIFAHRRLDDAAMAQVASDALLASS